MSERMFDSFVVAHWAELAEQAQREIDVPRKAVSDWFTPEANEAVERLRAAIAVHVHPDIAERAKTNWIITNRPVNVVVAEELDRRAEKSQS